MKLVLYLLAAAIVVLAAADDAELLPGGPGKETVAHTCLECHDSASFRKKRLDRDAWSNTVGQMVDQGSPERVLTAENMRIAYGAHAHIGRNPVTGRPMILALTSVREERE